MSRTITEKCPRTALAAPMPTTLPSSTLTTGTVASCSAYSVLPRWPGRNEPPPPTTRGRPALMAPGALLADAVALAGLLRHHRRDAAAARRAVEQADRRGPQLDRQPVEVAAFGPIAPSAWPPREVKSSAQTIARPSIVPGAADVVGRGERRRSPASSYVAKPARLPTSRNDRDRAGRRCARGR